MTEEAIPDWLSYLLTVYRHPLRYRESLRTALLPPQDMTLVLRIAGGDTQAVDGHCAADIEPDNLREAAIFFTEQFCFAPAADYYRTLGLPVDADEERIKEHYRLLMRMFHPDRPASRGAWTDGYARRVNQAYNTLRHTDRRQAYRRSLEHSVKAPILDLKTSLRRQPPFSEPSIRWFLPLRWLSPPLIMGMVATLALLFVLMVYLANPSIPPAGPALSKEQTVSSDPVPTRTEEPISLRLISPFAKAKEGLEGISGGHEGPVETKVPSAPPLAKEVLKEKNNPVNAPKPSNPDKAAPISSSKIFLAKGEKPKQPAMQPQEPIKSDISISNSRQPTPQDNEQPQPPPLTNQRIQPSETASRESTATPSAEPKRIIHKQPMAVHKVPTQTQPVQFAASARTTAIVMDEISSLLERYRTAYEQGNLKAFMTLFHDQVRSSEGSFSNLKNNYADFFNSTRRRRISFSDLDWRLAEHSANGTGHYEVNFKTQFLRIPSTASGSIRFSVRKEQERLLIDELYYSE